MSLERQDGQQNQQIRSGSRAAGKKARMANLELLRCLAMFMVVILHFLGKGNILPELSGGTLGVTGTAAWLLECFCIVAVNLYMLISGYFLCVSSFKLSRLLTLWLQVWVYSVGIGLLAYALGIYPASEFSIHYLLTLGLPVLMEHYWFLTSYVFLYVLLPLIGRSLREMNRTQMQMALALLLLLFCIAKSVLPARLETDGKGYDCLWYLCVFLVAAYIRRFGMKILEKKWICFLGYLLGVLGVFGLTMGLRLVYLATGSLEHIVKIAIEYNHLLPLAASVGLFGFFLKLRVPEGLAGVINRIAPYTLGVYLLHENLGVRYAWQKWFGAESIAGVGELLGRTFLAAAAVFAAGVLIDMLRAFVMRALHLLLQKLPPYRRLTEKILAADSLFYSGK